MTAMRNSVYAILAVVVGVMLVGLLPGQLSNLAAPAPAILRVGGTESAPNVTTTGGPTYFDIANGTILNSKTSSLGNDTSAASAAATAAKTATDATGSEADTETFTFSATVARSDPYADAKYYGLWGVGLLAALAVYFASKRMLG